MTQPSHQQQIGQRQNRRVAILCTGVVAGMVGMAYAAVPLYDLFCRVTGYGGTTQVTETFADEILDQTITIEFDSSIARGLPWKFEPVQRSQTLKIGEMGLALYRATNTSDRTVVGTATYNVTPQKVGAYFAKIECFCFQEQELKPGESIEMPVSYFVDPSIVDDPFVDEVKTITLSYTFFEKKMSSQEDEQQVSLLAE